MLKLIQGCTGARNQTNDLAETGPSTTQPAADGSVTPVTAVEDQQSVYSQQLAEIDEFKGYGAVLKSSKKAIELTERETEYVVTAVKHIFKEHIVFQVCSSVAVMCTRVLNWSVSVRCAQHPSRHGSRAGLGHHVPRRRDRVV